MKTVNNLIMVETYKGERKIKSKVNCGYASIQQKSSLVKLKVLEDALVIYEETSIEIKKDSYVLVKEELLYTQKHLSVQFDIEEKGLKFSLIGFANIVGIVD